MKTFKLMLIAVCMLVGFNAMAQTEKKNNKESEVTFKSSIDCHSCEQKIMKNIPFDKGVKDVKVDLDKKEIKIKYRTDKTDKEKLKKSIEKLGYTAEEVVADASQTAVAETKSCCSKSGGEHSSCSKK